MDEPYDDIGEFRSALAKANASLPSPNMCYHCFLYLIVNLGKYLDLSLSHGHVTNKLSACHHLSAEDRRVLPRRTYSRVVNATHGDLMGTMPCTRCADQASLFRTQCVQLPVEVLPDLAALLREFLPIDPPRIDRVSKGSFKVDHFSDDELRGFLFRLKAIAERVWQITGDQELGHPEMPLFHGRDWGERGPVLSTDDSMWKDLKPAVKALFQRLDKEASSQSSAFSS